MKQIHPLLLLLPLLFLLTACPYSAEYPLDKPTQKISKDFLGKWIEQGGDKENPNFFTITDAGGSIYQFEKNEYNSSEKKYDASLYTGYFTQIGKTNFLNLKKNEEQNYYFYKFELAKDTKSFVFFEVTDNIDEKFSNGNEMKAFFEKNKEISFFYNKDEKTYNKQ